MGWVYGSGNPNNNKTTYGASTKVTSLLTNVASGTTQPVDSQYEVIASATGGSLGSGFKMIVIFPSEDKPSSFVIVMA